jgi:hypothetical protein
MYNLTVDDAHTFFVGEQAWLVHNTCIYSRLDLGTEPGSGTFRIVEADTGERLVQDYLQIHDQSVTSLSRSPDLRVDWVDNNGVLYDGVTLPLDSNGNPVPYKLGNPQGPGSDTFLRSIFNHFSSKSLGTIIVIDTTNLRQADVAIVVAYVQTLVSNNPNYNYIGLGPGWVNFR